MYTRTTCSCTGHTASAAGSLRSEVQLASFAKTFISQQNRDLLLQALRNQSLKLVYEGNMSVLVCSFCGADAES